MDLNSLWSLTAQNIGSIYSELLEKLKKLEQLAHFANTSKIKWQNNAFAQTACG